MDWLWIILVGIASWIIGVFGLCQIIGVLRTRRYRATGTIIFTLTLWAAILGFATFSVHKWLYDYRIAFYIAMVISLVMSWNTGKNGPEENSSFEQNLAYVKQVNAEITDQMEELEKINNMISTQQNMLDKAIYDLGNLTADDVVKQLNIGLISKEQADESINEIETLQYIIKVTPANIEMLENKKREILSQINQ